ncbi:tautomerase family protein [Notoacmeibacter sp. MSK16QG-6]|uniref:tautomerase family protein n=1 Tax=Notoacmeibacter sp. MSK16QG-6 TaxID=2957982 RepID=UPI0020A016B2|nr:tautomerase family protein [Notoacmeibacter sp. MSK16QG-6]MCP1200541.1 tautomerase family protein [Notoacmeibacter sp. MSK16QG-6]
MPFVQVSMQSGKSPAYRQSILDGLSQALQDTLQVPEGDEFMTITEHEPENFRFGHAFGVQRTGDLLYIAITLFDTRTIEHKAEFFRRVVELLSKNPGIRSEDVFINVYPTPKENWSVGNGEMQFGPEKISHG